MRWWISPEGIRAMGKPDETGQQARWGLAYLVGTALAAATCLVATALGFPWVVFFQVALSLGGWLLVFSAVAFFRADRELGKINVRYGSAIGSATMFLLLFGWVSIGQVVASVVSGAIVGAVIAVPFGWIVGSIRRRFAPKGAGPDLAPADLRDPWLDA